MPRYICTMQVISRYLPAIDIPAAAWQVLLWTRGSKLWLLLMLEPCCASARLAAVVWSLLGLNDSNKADALCGIAT